MATDCLPAIGCRKAFLVLFFLVCFSLCGCTGGKKKDLKIGDPAPPLATADINGNTVNLANHKGKPVLLRFFYPDCQFCKADTPVFSEYYERYRDKGLLVAYIDTDPDLPRLRQFIDSIGIRFPVILDSDGKLAASFRVRAVPQTVALDPEHRIIAAIMGGVSREELDELLKPFLQ